MLRFQVEGMSCEHCRTSVTAAVRKVWPTARVEVELETGRVAVDAPPDGKAPDRAAIVAAIRAVGYETV